MKRKIAILLSAMMVTSAMPMTASAAHLKADGVLNTTFAKPNETIDVNAGSYSTYNTLDELKGRRSVVKIALKDDGTNSINGVTTFKVQLENGTFDKDHQERYQYYNSVGTKLTPSRVTYDDVKDLSDLKSVFDKVSKLDSTGNKTVTTAAGSEKVLASEAAFKELNTAIEKAKNHPDFSKITSEDDFENFDKVTEEDAKNGVVSIKKAIENLKYAIVAENQTNKVEPHIPYKLVIDSPTTATVTVPNYMLKDTDKEINMGKLKKVDISKIGISFGTNSQNAVAGGTSSGITWTNVANGSETITKVYLDKAIGGDAVTTDTEDTKLSTPYIALPLGAVVADGNAPVKAKITSDYNDKVVGGEYTITTNIQEGDTSLVYEDKNVKRFEDYTRLESVVIKENVRRTIADGGDSVDLTVRLSGGYRFKTSKMLGNPKGEGDVAFYNDKTGEKLDATVSSANFSANDSVLKVTIKGLNAKGRDLPIGIRIENLYVEPISEKTYGDVELSVSGNGITNQSKLVAKREKLGYKLTTLKDPKEIISGRHYKADSKNNMSEPNNTTVKINFSEAIPNTLVESRALDFNLPEGVKVVGMEIDNSSIKNIRSKSGSFGLANFEVINNGRTLRLIRDTYTVTDPAKLASFTFELDLSVAPGFSGDIKLGVTGGGQADVTEAVIAKAVLPFEIKSQTTKANLGYQDYNTADITITETRPGMFLQDEIATLNLSAPYGTQELGFSEAKFEVSGGELEVKEKDFKVGENDGKRGSISFKINKASYKNPSTITIKNVKIGTTRSVPFGSYDLKLGGKAVINNHQSEVKDDSSFNLAGSSTIGTTTVENNHSNPNLYMQDDVSTYDFKNYVNVITETGTFDQTVKVTVGEKTVLVGSQAIDMDVAPYIQASSNSTMVPLRFVSVALGVDTANVSNPDASNKIAWDANTKTTTIYYGAGTGQKIIQFQAGSNIMTVDGTRIPMEYGVKAEIKDGRMFVPFRALGQALGVTVSWDADTRTAIYNEGNARNANTTTATSTTATSTTVSGSSTTESTTKKESSTESTTASKDSTTETTTKK